MTEYALAHPWLTFFLVMLALFVIDGMYANFVRMRIATRAPKPAPKDEPLQPTEWKMTVLCLSSLNGVMCCREHDHPGMHDYSRTPDGCHQ